MTRQPEDALFARFRAACAGGRPTASGKGEQPQDGPAALAAVFDRLAPDLLRIAGHLCGRIGDAEDLVQQTFLVAIERAPTWDEEFGLFPWMVGILTNQARLRRRRAARAPDPDRLRPAACETPDELAQRAELEAAVQRAAAELGEIYRPVLHLHLFFGLNAKEIGAALGRPAGTVRTQLVRGLEQLRRVLPAGIGVVAAATVSTGRGLAAVRAEVLGALGVPGANATLAAGAAASLGSFLAMKKSLFASAAVLVLALGSFWLWPRGAARAPVRATDQPSDVAALSNSAAAAHAERAVDAGLHQRRSPVHPAAPGRVNVLAAAAGEDPIADARVLAWPGSMEQPSDPRTLRVTRTDAQGAATIDPLAPGRWQLQARLGRAASAVRTLDVAAGSAHQVKLELAVGGRVHGRVVDEAGQPVAGAAIWAGDDVVGHAGDPDERLRLATHSADDGTFALAYAAGEERLAARKEGYAASWSFPTAQLGDGEVILVLGCGPASVTGQVTSRAGLPIGGAQVALQLEDEVLHRDERGGLRAPRLPVLLRTDAAGQFRSADLAPGRYRGRVVSARHAAASVAFAVAAGARATLAVQLDPAATVTGRVIDRQGTPLGGVWVWATELGTTATSTTRTSADGRFALDRVPMAPLRLAAAHRVGGRRVERDVAPASADPLECEIVLDALPGIRGRLRSAAGAALGGWTVGARDAGGETVGSTPTAADGSFALADLGPGVFTLSVRSGGDPLRPAGHEFANLVAGGESVDLEVPAGALPQARITGRVVNALGHPLPAAWFRLFAPFPADGSSPAQRRVDADGTFAAGDLGAGSYTLLVTAPGCIREVRELALDHAQTLALGDIVLPPEAGLRVRFVRPDGSPWGSRPPVPWLKKGGTPLLAGVRGGVEYALDGDEVVVLGLGAGRYTVHGPGGELLLEPRDVVLHAGATTRIDVCVDVGRIREFVFEPPAGGTADEALHVEVRDAAGKVALATRCKRELAHHFTCAGVFAAGRYVVTAHSDGGARYRAEFAVDRAWTAERTVAVPRVQ